MKLGYAEDGEGEVEADGDNLEAKEVNSAFFRLAQSVLPALPVLPTAVFIFFFIYLFLIGN